MDEQTWRIYHGLITSDAAQPTDPANLESPLADLPEPPPWRQFENRDTYLARVFRPDSDLVDVVNMALYLRRPLLITGKPGTGKSSLAASIAVEMRRLPLLRWPITSRSSLQEGLYTYDAVRRLQDTQLYVHERDGVGQEVLDPVQQIGDYIKLGPLGTAMLPSALPRVLLIDEIDKSDIDLPNDLLNIFEEGTYEIPEVRRHRHIPGAKTVTVRDAHNQRAEIPVDGMIRCEAFPIIVMTSNQERDFPPAFLRRCLRYELPNPNPDELADIVARHLDRSIAEQERQRILDFVAARAASGNNLATDQLLNLLYLVAGPSKPPGELQPALQELLTRVLLGDLSRGV